MNTCMGCQLKDNCALSAKNTGDKFNELAPACSQFLPQENEMTEIKAIACVILQASNVDYNITMTPAMSEDDAYKKLRAMYEELRQSNKVAECSFNKNHYCVRMINDDTFYAVIHPIV